MFCGVEELLRKRKKRVETFINENLDLESGTKDDEGDD